MRTWFLNPQRKQLVAQLCTEPRPIELDVALNKIADAQALALRLRFGLDGYDVHSWGQVAEHMQCSRGRAAGYCASGVRQIMTLCERALPTVPFYDPGRTYETYPWRGLINEEQREAINRALYALSHRERYVVALYYGLNSDGYRYTLDEIAALFKRSRERIRQIANKAVRKLHKYAWASYNDLALLVYTRQEIAAMRPQTYIVKEDDSVWADGFFVGWLTAPV